MAQLGADTPAPRIRPCAGIDGAPCPQQKGVVVRGTGVARCPDCTLAQGRIRQAGKARKATPAKVDDAALLDRINRVRPPGYDVVDGVLESDEDEIPDGSEGDNVEDVLEEIKPQRAKQLAKPPKKRGRGATPFHNQSFKPGTRQPAPPPAKPTGELPWWARAKPGEMTTTAKQERERMQNSKEAKQVPGTRIID